MRGAGTILAAFILFTLWALNGCTWNIECPSQATGGGGAGITLEMDAVTPIEGPDDRLVYPVKFVCGSIFPQDMTDPALQAEPLSPGDYLTAINIVNPIGDEGDATLEIRATQTFVQDPGNGRGIVGSPVTETLPPYNGLEIDCSDIRELLEDPPDELLEGFVLIETDQPLSVVPVYTAKSKSAEEDLIFLSSSCLRAAYLANLALNDYLIDLASFLAQGGPGGSVSCEDLKEKYERAQADKGKCLKACLPPLPCPSLPTAPGKYPGTEACGVQ